MAVAASTVAASAAVGGVPRKLAWRLGGDRGGWYGRGWYGRGYSPWAFGYWGYPGYDSWDYPAYGYADYPSGGDTDYFSEPSYYTNAPVYGSGSTYIYGTSAAAPAQNDTAQVTVRVPADAQVWFQNQPTTQQGAVRHYQSPQLSPGQEYSYDIRAQWRQGGRAITQERHVAVHAGSDVAVDFTAPAADQRQASASATTSGL